MRNFDSLHDSFVQKMALLQLVITLQPHLHFDEISFMEKQQFTVIILELF